MVSGRRGGRLSPSCGQLRVWRAGNEIELPTSGEFLWLPGGRLLLRRGIVDPAMPDDVLPHEGYYWARRIALFTSGDLVVLDPIELFRVEIYPVEGGAPVAVFEGWSMAAENPAAGVSDRGVLLARGSECVNVHTLWRSATPTERLQIW